MLGAFNRKKDSKLAQEQADALQAMINASRKERKALDVKLQRVHAYQKRLTQVGDSLQQIQDQAAGTRSKIEDLTKRMTGLQSRVRGFEQIESKIQALGDSVKQAGKSADQLLAPQGELKKHKQAVQQLSSQIIRTTSDVDTLKQQQVSFRQLREELRQAQKTMGDSVQEATRLKGDLEKLRGDASNLKGEHGEVKELLHGAREDAAATAEVVKQVEKKVGALGEINELSSATEKRLATLNSLSEHVAQKIKALENQKQVVEHAVVESNRLGELVWNMDLQIQKLDEGSKRAAQVDAALNRIEQVSAEISDQLEGAQKTKLEFAQDLAKLDKNRSELSEFVEQRAERLALDRKEFDSFSRQVKMLQGTISGLERNVNRLDTKGKMIEGISRNSDKLAKQFGALNTNVEHLKERQSELGALQGRLDQVGVLADQITRQQETLMRGSQQLEVLRKEFDLFHKTQADITKTRDRIGDDRAAFEAFLARVEEFRQHIPELDSRMNGITSKLAVVEEGTQKAAAVATMVEEIDNQMSRVSSYQKLIEEIDARLNGLNALSLSVDERFEKQIARGRELESFQNVCDGLGLQVADAQQKLKGVSALQDKLLPLTNQVATLRAQADKARLALKEVRREEAELSSQEERLAELSGGSRSVADSVEEKLNQVRRLNEELTRGTAVKEELVLELGAIQGRQRDFTAHVQAFEEQIKQVEAKINQLDQRHSQLAFAEKRLVAFEKRLGDLQSLSDDVAGKIEVVAVREAFVGSVKKEVDEIHQISRRSREELQHLVDQRNEIGQLSKRVEELLKSVGETEERIAVVNERKALVDEVQMKANFIVNMLEDVRVNLEVVSEQRSVVDHVVETIAGLDERVQRGQAVLKALRIERELAERIQQGIKLLRAKPEWSRQEKRGGKQIA